MQSRIQWYMLATMLMAPPIWGACDAASGVKTTALLELYTSEGCSSCPPADQRLGQMPGKAYPGDEVVPIALHVDYWDYVGWHDPYAQHVFSERQNWLVERNAHHIVYTPHFFVAGKEVQSWRDALDETLREVNALAVRAQVSVHADLVSPGTLTLTAQASTSDPKATSRLYLAVTENNLISQVKAGENSGATLRHSHVVREWIGPVSLVDGKASVNTTVKVIPSWNLAQLGVVGFVEDTRSGEVLQAVSTQQCAF